MQNKAAFIPVHKREFNPGFLVLAREAAGFTQKKFAEELGVTQSKVSKTEDGLISNVKEEDLRKYGEILDLPWDFFTQAGIPNAPSASVYRKRSSMPIKLLHRIDAVMNIRRLQIEKLMASADLDVKPLPSWDPDELEDGPKQAAQMLRQYWNVPHGPINDIVELIENAGIPVCLYDFGTLKLDGVTMWSHGGFPIIFLNSNFNASRLRLTAAHELGHVIMHRVPNENMESQAWDFGAEFMMPENEIRPSLYPVNLSKLLSLKMHWKISMQAILYHGKRIGAINERYSRYLSMEISKAGYRKCEPNEESICFNKPRLLSELIDMHLNDLNYSREELSKSLSMTNDQFNKTYFDNPIELKIV